MLFVLHCTLTQLVRCISPDSDVQGCNCTLKGAPFVNVVCKYEPKHVEMIMSFKISVLLSTGNLYSLLLTKFQMVETVSLSMGKRR